MQKPYFWPNLMPFFPKIGKWDFFRKFSITLSFCPLNSCIKIEKNPIKKKELSDCKNHEDVINLTSKWGFEIGKRWGEY